MKELFPIMEVVALIPVGEWTSWRVIETVIVSFSGVGGSGYRRLLRAHSTTIRTIMAIMGMPIPRTSAKIKFTRE